MFNNFPQFVDKFKGEIKISFLTVIVSTVITIFVTILFETREPIIILSIVFGSISVTLLFALLVNLKRFLTTILFKSRYHLIEVSDLFEKSKYQERLSHFSGEKQFLAKKLVEEVLSDVGNKIKNDTPDINQLNIILDSGTTITPIFQHLMTKGLPDSLKKIKSTIYTNNLAGIRELYKVDPSNSVLSERDFNLIGGQPLSNYRATTGETTQAFLSTIWERQNKNKNERTLSILTANWLIGGFDLKNLQICAKGEGHFRFKKSLINNSKYIIVVTPLGKILRMKEVEQLNKFLPNPDSPIHSEIYKAYPVSGEIHDESKTVHLLTTFRPKESQSPFYNLSLQLSNTCDFEETENYVICDNRYEYEPKGDKWDIIVTELPHIYIRKKFADAYGYTTDLLKQ